MKCRLPALAVLLIITSGWVLSGCGLDATSPTTTAPPTIPSASASPTVASSLAPASTSAPVPSPSATLVVTSTNVPSPGATPMPASRLTWDALRNAAYPIEGPREKVARVVDGVYREKYMPDSATELAIGLADVHTHGDLDGDGTEDSLVILVSRPGGSGTFFYLAAVLNQSGLPRPVATTLLGDRVIVRSMTIESGRIMVEMINQGPTDPMCCPNQDSSREYVLEDGRLNLVNKIEKPRDEPAVPLDVEPERIQFAPGTTSVVIEGSIFPIGFKKYVLRAQAGQTMVVAVTSPYDHVFLSSYGIQDNTVLMGIRSEATTWSGQVPSTQDYAINLISVAGSETTFTLQVDIRAPAPPKPEPTSTLLPQPTKVPGDVIYLTFDDGPTGPSWTPQVLEALARHDAKATFFVLGQLAQRFPQLIQAEVDAGHSVGNHTFDHRTLDGIGRETFFNELLNTEKALGDKGSKCMRPPYGATDGYTVAYAAELGYKVVLWDIDTQD